MITKPEKETTLQLPTSDALAQALSFLQNVNSVDDVKMSDIKKAVECIENGEKEEENLLPEVNEESGDETETNEQLEEELANDENPDITTLFQEIKNDEAELEEIENTEITTYKNNLPRDTEYEKEMNDTIKQSL